MSRIFITGSADGLGKMAAQILVKDGHEVVLHARNPARVKEALAGVPGALSAIAGDLSSIEQMKDVAKQANAFGVFDAVIHNAAIGYQEPSKRLTVDGLPEVFAINSLAPYVLTSLIGRPKRLVYISSGLHRSGNPDMSDLTWEKRKWNGSSAYSDSKLHNVILSFAAARLWKDIYSNAIEPGWVATKMGGQGAPDSLEDGPKTQAWLAVSDEKEALVNGKYFFHKRQKSFLKEVNDPEIQSQFLSECERLSGIKFPIG